MTAISRFRARYKLKFSRNSGIIPMTVREVSRAPACAKSGKRKVPQNTHSAILPTGKSFIAFKLVKAHSDVSFLWISPSAYLFKTQCESVQRGSQELDLSRVSFCTYAKLLLCSRQDLENIAAASVYASESGNLQVPKFYVTLKRGARC